MNILKNKAITLALITLILFLSLAFTFNSTIISQIDNKVNIISESIQITPLIILSKIIAYGFDTLAVWIISIPISLYFWKRKPKWVITFIIILLLTGILTISLKEIISRDRPENLLMPENGYAFPSGHSSIAIPFFGMLAYLVYSKKRSIPNLFIILPILIILSRVYLNVHWLSDVIGGTLLGTFTLCLGIYFLERKNKK